MDSNIENMSRKVDAIYAFIANKKTSGVLSHGTVVGHSREAELEQAIRKAINELEMTKSSFKSKQIMRIKEELTKAVK